MQHSMEIKFFIEKASLIRSTFASTYIVYVDWKPVDLEAILEQSIFHFQCSTVLY